MTKFFHTIFLKRYLDQNANFEGDTKGRGFCFISIEE